MSCTRFEDKEREQVPFLGSPLIDLFREYQATGVSLGVSLIRANTGDKDAPLAENVMALASKDAWTAFREVLYGTGGLS